MITGENTSPRVSFRSSLWGFDRHEVRAFVENLAAEYETTVRQLERATRELTTRSPGAPREPVDREAAARTIEKTLAGAERLADEIRAEASRESERVIADAQRRAATAIEQAETRAQQIVDAAIARSESIERGLELMRTRQKAAGDAIESSIAALDRALADMRSQPPSELSAGSSIA